MQVLVI